MIEILYFPDFRLNLFSLLRNLQLLLLHPRSHLVELLSLSIEVLVLLLHQGFVIVQELSHLIYLRVFENLEPVESRDDLIGRRDFSHLCDALAK